MKMNRGLLRSLAGVVGLVLLLGCQALSPGVKQAYVDNGQFMDLWNAYSRCKSGTAVDLVLEEAARLTRSVQTLSVRSGFVLPLPEHFERFVSEPSPRLAVDVKAMAAACSLHTGHLALSVGKNNVAFEMFQNVIKNHTQPEYAYYVSQAKLGLAAVDIGLQASIQQP